MDAVIDLDANLHNARLGGRPLHLALPRRLRHGLTIHEELMAVDVVPLMGRLEDARLSHLETGGTVQGDLRLVVVTVSRAGALASPQGDPVLEAHGDGGGVV